MSFPTTSTFITNYTKGWEDWRVHPAVAWLEKCTKAFDARKSWSTPYSDWHTDDYTFIKPNGETTTGGDPAFKATKESYSAFSSSIHEPKLTCVLETQDAWYMIGEAILYGDFPDTGAGCKEIDDLAGRQWDVRLHGMFRF